MWKTMLRTAPLACALAWLAPAAALAQPTGPCETAPCQGEGRMGRGPGRGSPMYDVNAVTTVQGEITDIQRIERHRHAGVHLTLAVGSETLPVHLGPDFYVDSQALKLAKGDKVEVKGSRLTFQGKPAIVAQEVRRGGEVLALRDANGVPLWRGQGAGR